MEKGIKLVLSGEALEQKTPRDFEAYVGDLANQGLSVRVIRTREALQQDRDD